MKHAQEQLPAAISTNIPAAAAGEPITVPIFDLNLQGLRWGQPGGVPVLALHGWLDNANSFLPLCSQMDHWQTVAVELPGHGFSDHRAAHATYHVLDWIKDVLAIVDALAWQRCVLLGHSMGGAIAALFAGCFPERVERIILLDGFGPVSAPAEQFVHRMRKHADFSRLRASDNVRIYKNVHTAARLLARAVPNLSLANANLLSMRNVRHVAGGVTWSYDARLRDPNVMTLTEEQVQSVFEQVICPVLWVRSEQGYPFDEQALITRKHHLGQVSSLSLPGGHHAHMDAPLALCRAVAAFANK